MKFKLDENLDVRLVAVFSVLGDEADTVLAEDLSGRSDEVIYETCRKEARVLITLDLDFANPMRFPPDRTEGIIVLRPARPTLALIKAMIINQIDRFLP